MTSCNAVYLFLRMSLSRRSGVRNQSSGLISPRRRFPLSGDMLYSINRAVPETRIEPPRSLPIRARRCEGLPISSP
ncbi:hypothetical protein C3731_18715 [Brucella oryzae]|uniref:Uncharacterized protein n=1 Tax=Brucella oryzae TaxID=335286 RepID=A0A2S7IVS6_9HYPH|nr:hypothetical protein C3731_18715 [Brucella oryzae]